MAIRCIPRFVLSLLCVGLLVALSSSPVAASVTKPAGALDTTANTPVEYPLAAVDVSGTISSNTTWTLTNSPYRVTGNVTVAAGVTLTIEQGVVVQFAQYTSLVVDGTLNAVGTSANPITFTGTTEAAGWWRGLYVQNAGSATLRYATIAYGGYWDSMGLVKSGAGSLDIQHSIFRNIAGDGLRITEGASSFTSANNTFRNNSRYGVNLGINVSFADDTSTFAENGIDVYLNSGTITLPVTWNLNPAYSFYASGNLTVGATGELSILPATVVKFAQTSGLWVDGSLRAEGTAAAPIFFTDWRDDTVGGDANNNGDANAPAPNWWRGLYVRNAGTATLTYVTIAYGGYWDSMGLVKSGTGPLALQQSTIRQIAGDGLRVADNTGGVTLHQTTLVSNTTGMRLANAGTVSGQANTFHGNNTYGLLQDVNDTFGYTGNTFTGNGTAAVGINGGTRLTDLLLSPAGNPFRIIGNTTITATTTMTVEAGVHVEFGQTIGLWFNGTLHAVGTPTSPITFTGSTETSNWWRGLYVQNAGSARLRYATIAYGGYWDSMGIVKSGTGSLDLQHSTIRNIAGDGLRVSEGSSSFTSANTTFSNNSRYGVNLGINVSFDDTTS
ncbi:MAG: right-handed parallel beta-helix repeat-containing protein, partial [Chloroflexia bacterium]|nr:right-handed parallel beta-helix repeat-containing protein [Chloroflexia bacterium]